ncbi:hypothetical protein PHLGIDRAFT_87922, partial [Phlebiopsis gigantea 11061_1 CR5-6]
MKHEVERNSRKICWFLAPTVTLIEQQKDAIRAVCPGPVGLISGASAPDQWKDAALWSKILSDHRVMVSTPQILLDALRHGYILMGRDISLLVFDEAHHATSKHPYNEIMRGFYHCLPPREGRDLNDITRPFILGLTASPIYGGNIGKAFREIEGNLDCVIRSSRLNRQELSTFVHRPEFRYVLFASPTEPVPSRMLFNLKVVTQSMRIENDPYVIDLRSQLARLPAGEQRNRVDQRLSKTLHKEDTFSHKGLRDFERTAADICTELGPWAADWYIVSILELARQESSLHTGVMASWQDREKRYLLSLISRVQIHPISYSPDDIQAGLSDKVREFLRCLRSEERDSRTQEDPFSCIVFVTRRDAVLTLAKIISSFPDMEARFQVGCLLGQSQSFKRHAFLDISRALLKDDPTETLKAFRSQEKNVLVATAVAEEGLDIQACGTVIRFNPPENMVAWAQSRGRARKRRSTFLVMLGNDPDAADKLRQWQELEQEMIRLYTDPTRVLEPPEDNDIEEDPIEFIHEKTGAKLTLDSAMSHLSHFCSVLPQTSHGVQGPIFDLDPPEYESGWHSDVPRSGIAPYTGPWGATCTLPRQVPLELRKRHTSRVYGTKRSARNHAAFFAYHALFRAGLLNDHLLPLTSEIKKDLDGSVKLLLRNIEKRAGLTNSSVQYDPWQTRDEAETWFYNEVAIEGLPRLFMFTRRQLQPLERDELPTLYVPGQGKLSVDILSAGEEVEEKDVIVAAKEYTKRMFSTLHEKRLAPDSLDFCYVFLPMEEGKDEAEWRTRRQWQEERLSASPGTRSEAADFRERYPEVEVTYPLLVVQAFPRRANFLAPLESAEDGLSDAYPFLLHPRYATIELVGLDDVQYAFLLPSVLRFVSIASAVHTMRSTLFESSPALSSIPFSLLKTAVTAPVSQEPVNYQRLETLGDTVLKFIVSSLLHAQYPLWHEGYLAKRKDHAVNNNKLATEAIRLHMEKWLIRDSFKKKKQKKKQTEQLSTKMLADVVESLIGAAYEHGGFDLAIESAKLFGLGISNWMTIPDCVDKSLSRVEDLNDLPRELELVEGMLEYKFSRRTLLVEALTHASYTGDIETQSYERLEFLGDAVLDMIVTDFLYHAPGKNYTPGHMHIRKEALVNSHLLAFICMNTSIDIDATMPAWNNREGIVLNKDTQRIHLYRCLLHSSPRVLEDLAVAFSRWEKSGAAIQRALQRDSIYPWAALTSLQAPKFISDMLESLLGAIFLDSHGSLDVVRGVLGRLGIMRIMDRIVADDTDVLHP